MTEKVPVHFSITEAFIAEHDAYDILEPVGWSFAAHGEDVPLQVVISGLRAQQVECQSLLWYRNEVDNGGHAQFFGNAPSDLWIETYSGFDRLDLQEQARNLMQAIDILDVHAMPDGVPTRARLAELPEGAFAAHDEIFHAFDREPPHLDELILAYIRAHPQWFLFEGVVMKDAD
ncbi:MAG: DUF4375 domain-containing protein [Planctomycetota bacterium]|nr:DUF4375 domain-containing protein [Planctomycetota bacterium]